eukprot:scaffold44423_cov48-Cyclotella_meneghiniana.AAC.2
MEIENRLEEQPLQHPDENLNKWVIDRPGVIEAIQNNNPAITSVRIDIDFPHEESERRTMGEVDWEVVGQCLAISQHVKCLHLFLADEVWSPDDMRAFCRGLNLNRSIKMLEIYCKDNTTEVFQLLLPFFNNNTSLVLVDIEVQIFGNLSDGEVYYHENFPRCIGNASLHWKCIEGLSIFEVN